MRTLLRHWWHGPKVDWTDQCYSFCDISSPSPSPSPVPAWLSPSSPETCVRELILQECEINLKVKENGST